MLALMYQPQAPPVQERQPAEAVHSMKLWARPLARPQELQKLQPSAELPAGEPHSRPLPVLALMEPQATRPRLPKVR